MRERALSFGPANLVGILTEPDPGLALPGAPGDWAQVDPFGDALIPQDIIQAIIQQLSRGRTT